MEDPNIKLLNLISQLSYGDYNNLYDGVKQQLDELYDAIAEYKTNGRWKRKELEDK